MVQPIWRTVQSFLQNLKSWLPYDPAIPLLAIYVGFSRGRSGGLVFPSLSEFPGLVGAQYPTGDQWRNNSRKNEGMESKQEKKNKKKLAMDVTGDGSKV